MTISEEKELVAAAAAGNKEAMERLMESYRWMMVRAAHFSKVRTMAEDALGVAQLAFLQAVGSYEEKRGVNFAAYAKSAVRAGVHHFFRRELRHWQHEFYPGEGKEDAPSLWELVPDGKDAVARWETREDVKNALSRLSERERRVLELTFLRGMSQRGAAEVLSVRPQTVNDARKRALRKLKSYFCAEDTGGCLA